MLHFLVIGTILGLSAGFSPGPLTTLVISETLRHNSGAGIRVAVAPLITDAPIILFALLILASLPDSDILLASISLAGALFIGKMGLDNIMAEGDLQNTGKTAPHSLAKGIVTNLLSPHPYLFWLTVGVPIMARSWRENSLYTVVFLLVFYFFLVGVKIAMALVTARAKGFLSSGLYRGVLRLLGLVLLLLAVFLLVDAYRLFAGGAG